MAPADALGNNVFSVDVFDESHTRKKVPEKTFKMAAFISLSLLPSPLPFLSPSPLPFLSPSPHFRAPPP